MSTDRHGARATDESLRLLREVLWRGSGAVEWVRDNVFIAADACRLAPDDAQEIWDHADEADEALLGPLTILHPELKGLDDEAAVTALEGIASRLRLPRPVACEEFILLQLREALEEGLEHVREAAPYGVALLSEPGSGFVPEDIDEMWRDFAEAGEAIEAALLALEPDRFKSELRRLNSPRERVARAGELEQIELRREIVRRASSLGTRPQE